MQRIPSFHALRAFEAAARLGSFVRASEELHLTPSAISHQVRAVEQHLARALFMRTKRQVILTPDGERLLAGLSHAFGTIQEVCAELSPRSQTHDLSVHCAPSFAAKWLGPRLPRFMLEQPSINIRLSTSAEHPDLMRPDLMHNEQIDVAIAYGTAPKLRGITVRSLGPEEICALCSPEFAAVKHAVKSADFERIVMLESSFSPVRWADWFELTVVAPSLPGYGLSFHPNQKRLGIAEMADCFTDLMVNVLGHRKFAAQGGDWGAHLCAALGVRHPDRLAGIHVNMLSLRPDQPLPKNPTPEERRYGEEMQVWLTEENGYSAIQGTRPQTLAFALTDSPAGLAAWIAEKFHVWTDHDGDHETAVNRDRLLANIALYWFTGAIGSSFWPYYDRMHGGWPIPDGATVAVPTGYAAFPREIRRPPRSIAQQTYTDIRQWTVMEKGGHFAALEQPEALAADVRAFFRPLRQTF